MSECIAVHMYNTDCISLMLFVPLDFNFPMCACNLHCYYILHVVKAAETVALSPILRMPEITPSPSPCPTHPLQGNTTCMLSTLNCCFNQLLHVRMRCIAAGLLFSYTESAVVTMTTTVTLTTTVTSSPTNCPAPGTQRFIYT